MFYADQHSLVNMTLKENFNPEFNPLTMRFNSETAQLLKMAEGGSTFNDCANQLWFENLLHRDFVGNGEYLDVRLNILSECLVPIWLTFSP